MKTLKKFAASPAVTAVALLLAIALLGFSTIGGARAALTYYSDNYISTVQMQEIGVSLHENGSAVATGTPRQIASAAASSDEQENALLQNLTADLNANQPFRLNTHYQEELKVHNPTDNASGSLVAEASNITQYVRVTIYRYWTDANGDKLKKYDPAFIQLWLGDRQLGVGDALNANNWVEDFDARTDERIVLYYTLPVAPGSDTELFADAFSVDSRAGIMVEEETKNGVVTSSYLYNNANFHLEIRVDAVQDHNAADAILSAWGRKVQISEDNGRTLTLS